MQPHDDDEQPPPFLGTWKRVYTFIVCYLIVLISLFAWFTRSYAP